MDFPIFSSSYSKPPVIPSFWPFNLSITDKSMVSLISFATFASSASNIYVPFSTLIIEYFILASFPIWLASRNSCNPSAKGPPPTYPKMLFPSSSKTGQYMDKISFSDAGDTIIPALYNPLLWDIASCKLFSSSPCLVVIPTTDGLECAIICVSHSPM